MQGITDTDITFFSSMPKAGPLAGFGLIADGIQSYFDYINETNGGVDGHKLHLEVKDDGYVPDKTKSNVDEALGERKYAGHADGHRHAEQPGDLGHPQRRVHAAAAQRHRGPAVGRRHQPPVDDRHAARLRVGGRPVGGVAEDGAPGRHERRRGDLQQRLRQDATSTASPSSSRAPTSRSSIRSSTSRPHPT